MTLADIDREIQKLQKLRREKEKELLTNFEEYVGKYYKANDGFVIGKIYKVTDILKCKELFFDNEIYSIWSDSYIEHKTNEIEIISQIEFEQILDNWLNKIKKIFIKEEQE